MVMSEVATTFINNTGKMIYDENYPSLPIAFSYGKDKKEAVRLFLEYFLERAYTFDGVYAIGDSENDFGMLAYVESIGGVSNLIGKDIATFADFIENIKKDMQV